MSVDKIYRAAPDKFKHLCPDMKESSAVLHFSESELSTIYGSLMFAREVSEQDNIENYEFMRPWFKLPDANRAFDKIYHALSLCTEYDGNNGSCFFDDEWLAAAVFEFLNGHAGEDE